MLHLVKCTVSLGQDIVKLIFDLRTAEVRRRMQEDERSLEALLLPLNGHDAASVL